MIEFAALPQSDQQAIGKTLLTLLKAFDERDAESLKAVYSTDADWVNAFGTVKRGNGEIVEYLRGLFKDAEFNRGELAGLPQTSFKVLTAEVVIVSAHLSSRARASWAGARWTATITRCECSSVSPTAPG